MQAQGSVTADCTRVPFYSKLVSCDCSPSTAVASTSVNVLCSSPELKGFWPAFQELGREFYRISCSNKVVNLLFPVFSIIFSNPLPSNYPNAAILGFNILLEYQARD